MALLKLVQSFSLAPPVNTGGGMRVADGMVEFPVTTIITLPVPDAGAVIMVIVVLVAFSIGAVVRTIVTLELYAGVEDDEVEVNVEV
jgi:hypothetical protein